MKNLYAALLAGLLLASCHHDRPALTPEAKAQQQMASAARCLAAADSLKQLAKSDTDSAIYYHKQAHAPSTTAADSATLARFFSGWFSSTR